MVPTDFPASRPLISQVSVLFVLLTNSKTLLISMKALLKIFCLLLPLIVDIVILGQRKNTSYILEEMV